MVLSATVRFRSVLLVLLAFAVVTATGGGEPADNRYVNVTYYKESSPSRGSSQRYVLFVEFGVNAASIGQFQYGVQVDQPDLIESSLPYYASPGKDICPSGKKLNPSGRKLSEQDQQAGFHGGTGGELSLSPRRSLYTRIYSQEPLVLIDCFVERIDGEGRARETCDDLQLQVVEGQRCRSGVSSYQPDPRD